MTSLLSRADHVRWCKKRALEYLPHSPHDAFASMASDMEKHPETVPMMEFIGLNLLRTDLMENPEEMRRFINGFAE